VVNVGDKDITLQSEKMYARHGPFPIDGEEDPDLINVNKLLPNSGRTPFYSATSFAGDPWRQNACAILGAMVDDRQ
jgi:acyl CoA:acetate/3-ketoacid CoA transferase beta subunit